MQKELRQAFNDSFTEEKYKDYIKGIAALYPGELDFRVAETPIFIPKDFTKKMMDCCEDIIDVITDKRFKELTEKAIPADLNVPGENDHTHFIAFDFGVCKNSDGKLIPQLVEMQGFPTLFAFQTLLSGICKKYANVPDNYDSFLNGYDEKKYIQLLKEVIIGDTDPSQVILLEIFPEQQKTRIDFRATETLLGIKSVCITKLIAKENKLFYINNGVETEIKKIYNRLIFDDLQQQGLSNIIDLTQPWEVQWVTHPNWFYRISKYTLPLLRNPYVPQTYFLNEIKQIPEDIENYVLKPLFSFAGTGVVIDITQKDIDAIKDPENWILQRKVTYADAIITPDEPAKTEIRLFYFWKDEWERPVATHNLARLSKGKMIGTRYNKDKTWVGGSIAYFEKF